MSPNLQLASTLVATLAWLGADTAAACPQESTPAPLLGPARRIERPDAIVQLVASPDGDRIYLADVEGGLAAFDLEDEELLWSHGGRGLVRGLAAGKELVVHTRAGKLGYVGLDAETGEPVPDGDDSDPQAWVPLQPAALACDPRGRWVWLTIPGGLMRRDVGTAQVWSRRPLENGASTRLAMDGKADLLAVGGADGTIRFVGVASANVDPKKVLEAHAGEVTALAFDRRGRQLLSGGADQVARLWKLSSGKEVLEIPCNAAVTSVACDPRGRWVAVGQASGAVQLWSVRGGGEQVATLGLPEGGPCVGLVFVDSGKALVGARDRRVEIWDLTADL